MKHTAKLLALSATLAVVAACAPKETELGSAQFPSGIAAEQLVGTYKVERINGQRALLDLSAYFSDEQYGGYNGCNGFGGMGLAYGDRYFSAPGAQTLRACSSNTAEGRRGFAQGETASNIVGTGFTARNLGNERFELRSGESRMVIARLKPTPPDRREGEGIQLAGRKWEAFLLNGDRAPMAKTDDNQYLRFGDTGFTAKFTCDIFSGDHEQDGKSLRLSNIAVAAGTNCAGSDPAQEAQFRALLESDLRFVVSNSSILIASPDGQLFGDRERLKADR